MIINIGTKEKGYTRLEPVVVVNYLSKSKEQKIEETVDKVFRKYLVPASAGIGVLNLSLTVLAASADVATKLYPLIKIVQDLALPAGIIVSSWGLIEIIMGNLPAGKEKIKYSMVGFIGMFVIPEIFYTIRDAFQK